MKQHLILYRNLKYGELLDRMGGLLERYGGAAQETDGQKKPCLLYTSDAADE